MTFSQDEQAAAARADSEQPQEQTAPLKETSNEPTQLPIDEAFDLDDFDDEFDDDFESEIEGEYELEDDVYAEQLANIVDLDDDEFDDEFDDEETDKNKLDEVDDEKQTET